MESYEYLILGAGPSGLAFARTLLDKGNRSFVLLEKEDVPGGLCRSTIVDGKPLDIGGGHFLDVRLGHVTDFLFRFLPVEEWTLHDRVSTIHYKGHEIDYPFESNIWQLPLDMQLDFAESIANAGCNRGLPQPDLFEEWITWKLGEKIAREYMLPYNRKLWGPDLQRLGSYWLHKLPSVSLRDTLQSIIERRPAGRLPGHAQFYYPREYGYGEVWERIGKSLNEHLRVNTEVVDVDIERRIVNGRYQGKYIITTIPWPCWKGVKGIDSQIKPLMDELIYSSIQTDYYAEDLDSKAHWSYFPDESFAEHRILYRTNFCSGSRGYWTETNVNRADKKGRWSHLNVYAYPLNTINKPATMERLRHWACEHGICALGRWGLWEHMNSDVAVDQGVKLATELLGYKR